MAQVKFTSVQKVFSDEDPTRVSGIYLTYDVHTDAGAKLFSDEVTFRGQPPTKDEVVNTIRVRAFRRPELAQALDARISAWIAALPVNQMLPLG